MNPETGALSTDNVKNGSGYPHSGRTIAADNALPATEGKLRLRFLGSGDNFGSGGRFQACIHVDAGATRFLMDCGASSLIPMKRTGISTAEIDLILISHLHGDHFGGIPFFILDAQLISRREAPLVIAGPPGLERRARERWRSSTEARPRSNGNSPSGMSR